MSRGVNRLSAKTVAAAKKSGYYADGNGLYLQVSKSGSKSWIFRFSQAGREREMGLGSAGVVSLAHARQRVMDARQLLSKDLDPIHERRVQAAQAAQQSTTALTFDECAGRYIESHSV